MTLHCEKCSHETEDGLAVSGCAYCGCHDKESKKGESYRRGYSAGIAEERARVREWAKLDYKHCCESSEGVVCEYKQAHVDLLKYLSSNTEK